MKYVSIFEYHLKSSLALLKLIKIDEYYTGCLRKFDRGLDIICHPVAQSIDTKIYLEMEFLCFVILDLKQIFISIYSSFSELYIFSLVFKCYDYITKKITKKVIYCMYNIFIRFM